METKGNDAAIPQNPDGGTSTTGGSGLNLRKSFKSKNLRKRPNETSDEGKDSGLFQKKKVLKGGGKLSFSTSTGRPREWMDDGSKKGLKTDFAYESSRQVQMDNDSRATATLETETEFDRDARAIREKVLKNAEDALKSGKKSTDKIYKGMSSYTDHTAGFRREQTVGIEKAGGAHGPLRASAHIRWSVRFDYQPDICKDYKETGYCGYGDACIFLHDRGDYKSGWQLEQEWEENEKKRRERMAAGLKEDEGEDDEEDEEKDELPFACFICRENFTDPVVTKCKHYFCEHCALKHNAKSKNCFVCHKPTNGMFNTAHEIIKRMKQNESNTEQKEEDENNPQNVKESEEQNELEEEDENLNESNSDDDDE